MTRQPPAADEVERVVIKAGEFHFGGGATRISTLLGSCVSITLWHPRRKIGGMCHYMLTERDRPPEAPLDGRYASEAFALFLQHVAREGTRPQEYQAKLFGGARMFGEAAPGNPDVGARNVDYGIDWLQKNGIALLSRHVGGSGRRKLHFDLWSGDVWLAFPDGDGAHVTRPDRPNEARRP